MLVIVPVSSHDRGLIKFFCEVVNFFGPYSKNHQLLVVSRPSDSKYAQTTYSSLAGSFKVAELHSFKEDGPIGWPAGPNFYWHQTIEYLQSIKNTNPWLWMELDMTPIDTDWLDKLEIEYNSTDAKFLGFLQKIDLGMHLVGAGIYPGEFYKLYESWKNVINQNLAFDVACQEEIVKDAAQSKYIDHKFRTICYKCTNRGFQGLLKDAKLAKYPEFAKPVKTSAVLVHGCVDSSLAAIILNKENNAFKSAYNELFETLH